MKEKEILTVKEKEILTVEEKENSNCGGIRKGKVILLGISVFLQCKSEQDLPR